MYKKGPKTFFLKTVIIMGILEPENRIYHKNLIHKIDFVYKCKVSILEYMPMSQGNTSIR